MKPGLHVIDRETRYSVAKFIMTELVYAIMVECFENRCYRISFNDTSRLGASVYWKVLSSFLLTFRYYLRRKHKVVQQLTLFMRAVPFVKQQSSKQTETRSEQLEKRHTRKEKRITFLALNHNHYLRRSLASKFGNKVVMWRKERKYSSDQKYYMAMTRFMFRETD